MKKLLSILLIILIILSVNTLSIASELVLELNVQKEQVKQGTEMKVNIEIDNFTRKGNSKAIELKLEYDNKKLEYKQINWKNGWAGNYVSDVIVASKSGRVSEEEIIGEIIFLVKEEADKGNTEIVAGEILTSSDGDEVEVDNAEATIKIIEKENRMKEKNNKVIIYSGIGVLGIFVILSIVFYIKSKKN